MFKYSQVAELVDAIGENAIQMFTHLMQWLIGSNPVLTTQMPVVDYETQG